jgi:hypothetical protein
MLKVLTHEDDLGEGVIVRAIVAFSWTLCLLLHNISIRIPS